MPPERRYRGKGLMLILMVLLFLAFNLEECLDLLITDPGYTEENVQAVYKAEAGKAALDDAIVLTFALF